MRRCIGRQPDELGAMLGQAQRRMGPDAAIRKLRAVRLGVVMVVAAVGLAGCGRKGALEAPPGATLKAADTAAPDAPPKPDKPFFLDPLL